VTGAVDAEATFKSRDAVASNWDDKHQVAWVQSVGADLIRGIGRLAGPRRVVVERPDGTGRTLEADRAVVLATGSRTAMPPVDGLADARPWDNRDITSASHVPERLLVLGGGAVGVEMAQAFRRLGAREVTIVELLDRLLADEEPFAADELLVATGRRPATDDVGLETIGLEPGGWPVVEFRQ